MYTRVKARKARGVRYLRHSQPARRNGHDMCVCVRHDVWRFEGRHALLDDTEALKGGGGDGYVLVEAVDLAARQPRALEILVHHAHPIE